MTQKKLGQKIHSLVLLIALILGMTAGLALKASPVFAQETR